MTKSTVLNGEGTTEPTGYLIPPPAIDPFAAFNCDGCGIAFSAENLPVTRLGHDGTRHLLGCSACADVPAAVDLPALKDALTMAQRNGRACVVCGKSDYSLKPAGKLLGLGVVECDIHEWERKKQASPPVWMTEPCPGWCLSNYGEHIHGGEDAPEDRHHLSAVTVQPLLTMEFPNYESPTTPRYAPLDLMVDLLQHYREAEPRVVVNDTSDKFTLYLSLDEAQQHAVNVMEMVRAGRTRTDVVPFSAPGGAAEHKPWCNDHEPDTDMCRTKDTNLTDVHGEAYTTGLTSAPEEGTVVWLGDKALTVDQAEETAFALLAQARRARESS